jgi:flagellar motor switch/type III secretory pathway protein FliN
MSGAFQVVNAMPEECVAPAAGPAALLTWVRLNRKRPAPWKQEQRRRSFEAEVAAQSEERPEQPLAPRPGAEELSAGSPSVGEEPGTEPVSEEVTAMAETLSKDELDALLGPSVHQQASEEPEVQLLQSGEAAAEALADFLGMAVPWRAARPHCCTWERFAAVVGLDAHTTLLLTEVRLAADVAYAAATTLVACRLDEQAAQSGRVEEGDVALLGWRRVVEYCYARFYHALRPGADPVAASALPPRRWDPGRGLHPAGGEAAESIAVIRLHSENDADAVYMLIPSHTAGMQNGTTAATPAPVTQQALPESYLGAVGTVPLSIALLQNLGRQQVREVAGWAPGAVLPLPLQPGCEVVLLANGHGLARGRVLQKPGGTLAVEISELLPAPQMLVDGK